MLEGRWFYALAPRELAESPQILRVVQRLRRTAKEADWDVKWTPFDQLHLTLGFMGTITAEQRELALKVGERTAQRAEAIELDVKDVSAFPEPEAGRVVWVGVRRTQSLIRLHDFLAQEMATAGLPPATEEFVPHITLGRLRHSRHLVNWISPFRRRSFGEFRVSALSLFSSHQYGQKIVYKPQGEWDLIGNASFKKETK